MNIPESPIEVPFAPSMIALGRMGDLRNWVNSVLESNDDCLVRCVVGDNRNRGSLEVIKPLNLETLSARVDELEDELRQLKSKPEKKDA